MKVDFNFKKVSIRIRFDGRTISSLLIRNHGAMTVADVRSI